MAKNRKLFLVLLQLALWAAFVALPYFMVPRQDEQNTIEQFLKHYAPQPDMAENIFLGSLGFNFCLILFFYIHHYLLFDRLVVKKKYSLYLGVIVASFIAIFLLSYFYRWHFFGDVPAIMRPISFREWVKALTWYLLVLLISLGLKFLGQWQKAEERAQEIENDQLRTELAFLHAQINPHFLFNSLNTIYGLSLQKSDTAPLAVLKLSQLLRYVIDEARRARVPLEQEVTYLNNYIEMQKLRSTSTLQINFKVEGDIASTSIAPLLLLPFVENAFKYGISNHENSFIDIYLSRVDREITFTVKNKKYIETEKHSTGIGIPNVQRRLELLYPGTHTLEINDTPDSYNIKLKIPVT
ncbi:MAG: two-component system sensor protein no kinase domain [Bacteroidota bacterium]|nr:two-component system sensor protein no kinase domain [Bacteroidota bacterium]